MRLELQRLLDADPGLAERIEDLPGRVFSGKEHPTPGTKAVFFCYRLPRPDYSAEREDRDGDLPWTEEAGETRWYLYHLEKQTILEEPAEIMARSARRPRRPAAAPSSKPPCPRSAASIEKHIKNTFLKPMQAPVGVKPILKAWMELN